MQETVCVAGALLVVPSETTSVTEPVWRGPYVTEYGPAPVCGELMLPPTNVQVYCVAPVDVLVKVHVNPLHNLLMPATGPLGGGEGGGLDVPKCV